MFGIAKNSIDEYKNKAGRNKGKLSDVTPFEQSSADKIGTESNPELGTTNGSIFDNVFSDIEKEKEKEAADTKAGQDLINNLFNKNNNSKYNNTDSNNPSSRRSQDMSDKLKEVVVSAVSYNGGAYLLDAKMGIKDTLVYTGSDAMYIYGARDIIEKYTNQYKTSDVMTILIDAAQEVGFNGLACSLINTMVDNQQSTKNLLLKILIAYGGSSAVQELMNA